MGFLLDALLGHRAAKGQNPDERISPLAVAPVEVPTFMEYRFFDGHYKDEYQIPRAAPGQEELFFTGGCDSPVYTYYPLPTRGMNKGQRLRVEVSAQDVEFIYPDGRVRWRSDEWNDAVAMLDGVPFGGLQTSHLIFRSLALQGYKVVLDASYEGMYDAEEGIPSIVVHLPDVTDLKNWGRLLRRCGEFVPFEEYRNAVVLAISEDKWTYPDEIAGKDASNFSMHFVVPEKKSLKPRIEIKYKDCVLEKIYESNPDFEIWRERLERGIRRATFARRESRREGDAYYWRVLLMF